MTTRARPPATSNPRVGLVILALIVGWFIIGSIVVTINGDWGGGDRPTQTYSDCSTLDDSLGVDLKTAMCVDDNGKVVKYTDTYNGGRRKQTEDYFSQ